MWLSAVVVLLCACAPQPLPHSHPHQEAVPITSPTSHSSTSAHPAGSMARPTAEQPAQGDGGPFVGGKGSRPSWTSPLGQRVRSPDIQARPRPYINPTALPSGTCGACPSSLAPYPSLSARTRVLRSMCTPAFDGYETAFQMELAMPARTPSSPEIPARSVQRMACLCYLAGASLSVRSASSW